MDTLDFLEEKMDWVNYCKEVARRLHKNGHCLASGLGEQNNAISLMQSLGTLIKQYNGFIEHDVTFKPGFDNKAYSQSINSIQPHTEAPGWNPTPKFLSLFCKQQATCGGGHTALLDCERFLAELDADERSIMESAPIYFPGPIGGVKTPMLTSSAGTSVVRFSYNLLVSGEYDPPINKTIDPEKLPLGRIGISLANKITQIFERHCTSTLIPEGALLIWDNQRILHARTEYKDKKRHLIRYWIS